MSFDVTKVRADFPILNVQANGKPLVYLDNAASAQKPRAVIGAMTRMMETSYANVHRGLHYLSNKATDQFEAARSRVAQFINAGSADQVIFTRGATEAINLVAHGWGRKHLQAGDEIVLSVLEHHSNIVPWHFLREELGVVLKWVPVLADGSLDMEAYAAALSPRTKLVAISHMSNALGVINPADQIIAQAHAAGAYVLLDGCQAAPHFTLDMQALDCDFYVFSAHKIYGPTGIGALWAKADILESMGPYQGGGEMIDEVREDTVTYGKVPHRFEAGTPAIVEAIGFAAALDYLGGFDRDQIAAHEMALYSRARDGLSQINSVRIYGDTPHKGAILSFGMDGAHPSDVATLLDHQGIGVRSGHHCAQPLMARLGVPATARASFALYNTMEEADKFVEGVAKAARMLA